VTPKIFINYRGEDSQMCGALIHHTLSGRFGESKVFLDNISIQAGDDFEEVLLGRLRHASILLAVIGPRWLASADMSGRRYIDSPHDWVRRELAEAFALGKRVIPVLTDNAEIPPADALPAEIVDLSRRQYVRLRRRHTKEDLAQLVDTLMELDAGLAANALELLGPGIVPRQLPPAITHFVGRADELEDLSRLLVRAPRADAVVISAIGGTAGVGKTALAIQWAHKVRHRFSDGDLYVDLRGYGPGVPLEPGAALTGFLHALGVDGAEVRQELAERAAQFRTLMHGRRRLIVLDNARSEQQVRPLLPGSPSCLVLVTSRSTLPGLIARDGACRVDLGFLPPAESIELLRALIGHRVDAELAAAEDLANRCARLPLALRIVAELAITRPTTTLAGLVAELADVRHRLDSLNAGGDPHTAVRDVFSWSYNCLPPPAAGAFRLLGCHPGRTFDVWTVAALAQAPASAARDLIDVLLRAHLIDLRAEDRYAMHDLLRDYAAELALLVDSENDRRAALTRLFNQYRASSCAAMDLVAPHDKNRRPQDLEVPVETPQFSDQAPALAWLETERPNLVSSIEYAAIKPTVEGWHDYVLQMSAILYRYFETRAYDDDAFAVHYHALHLCEDSSDRSARAKALADVGHVYERIGRYSEALNLLRQAIGLAREAGDRVTEARALNGRGATCANLGLYDVR